MTESNMHIDTDPKAEAQTEERMRKQWALEATSYLMRTRSFIQAQHPHPRKDAAMQTITGCIERLHQEIIKP